MQKDEYLELEIIGEFLDYLGNTLPTLKHGYWNRQRRMWCNCDGIQDAVHQYHWPFSCTILENGTFERRNGNSLPASVDVLNYLSGQLWQAIEYGDSVTCQIACQSILDWGGVLRGNQQRVFAQGDILCDALGAAKEAFEANNLNDEFIGPIIRDLGLHMSSGYTKIYSCLAHDFVIYDGRVGAAIGMLVRDFYKNNDMLRPVNDHLRFPWGKGQGPQGDGNNAQHRRDPSLDDDHVPHLDEIKPEVYTRWNVRANWLLGALVDRLNLDELPRITLLRQLEAALFMIGYDINPIILNAPGNPQ